MRFQPDKKAREEARKHGQAAFEDLSTIFEYFEYDMNQQTGQLSAPPAALKLSYDATTVATRELGQYLNALPVDVRSRVAEKVKSEFNY